MKICSVTGCGEVVGWNFQMCRKHWAMVPLKLKDEINETYRILSIKPDKHRLAMENAIAVVLEQENDDGA